MKTDSTRKITTLIIVFTLLPASFVGAQQKQNPRYPDLIQGESAGRLARGSSTLDKLAPELQALYRQFTAAGQQSGEDRKFSDAELKRRFGILVGDKNPVVEVAVELAVGTDASALEVRFEKVGATVRLIANQTAYASLPVPALEALVRDEAVVSVSPVTAARLPEVPKAQKPPQIVLPDLTRGSAVPLANEFDTQGLTGKGVVIGILDTGIDWRHQDFINADGTSRLLYLYDPFDNSYAASQGKTGSRPPLNDAQGKPLGTLYTREQITAALKGRGMVHSTDRNGHGTAVAGTAAGNGRATANGVAAGTHKGAAPEADLIIIKAVPDSQDEPVFPYYLAAKWIVETAKAEGKACVLNLSLGNHYSAHDGSEPVEAMFNELAGEGREGVVICVAAGNEGKYSFHAGGTFGPRRTGQADVISPPIELFVARKTQLSAYFDHADDWGLIVSGVDNFFVDDKINSLDAYFYSVEGKFQTKLSGRAKAPASFSQFVQSSVDIESSLKSAKQTGKPSAKSGAAEARGKSDRLVLTLPPGKYVVRGFGATSRVTNGRFDLYLDSYSEASFGNGAEAKFMIASPGNAENVLTVAAYDFRGSWQNALGKQTSHNLSVGELSDYSSPGYRRDGVIKPDIAAPATYAIAALAAGSAMAKDGDGNADKTVITRDGLHLAWSGTSAASPYVAGVVALLLQKNSRLDAAEIRDLLTRTATTDRFTGAVPNPRWGYGKINPAAAIRETKEDRLPLETASSPVSSSASSLSAAVPPLASAVAVNVTAREELILQAGELHGMTKGSRFALYTVAEAAATARVKDFRPVAEAEITALDSTTATLALTDEFRGKVAVTEWRQVRAVELAHHYGDNRLRVDARGIEATAQGKALIARLESLPLINLVNSIPGAGDRWDVRLHTAPTDRLGAAIVVERRDGGNREFAGGADLIERLGRALESESRWHFLRALENRDRDSQIKIELRVVPVEVELDSQGRVRRVIADREVAPPSGGRLVLTEGDFVMLDIKNAGVIGAYITILDLRSDGLVAPLFPHPSVAVYDNKIPVGSKWQRLPLPFIFRIEKPYGLEIFKAIATRDKTDFSALLDAETFARGGETSSSRSPLGQLLMAAATGRRATLAAVAPAGWATASATFEVVPRQ